MNSNQQLIIDLHDIEVDTIKKEKNFDFRTALIKLFKALYELLRGKQDVSQKDLANAAEKESKRLGLEDRYNWSEIFGLEEKAVQGVKENNKEQKVETSEDAPNLQQTALLSSKPYPDNFYVGQAIGDGSCFFDSFRQSLEQQKGIKITVKQLRNNCREFAQNNPPKWFINAITGGQYNDSGRSETVDTYSINIMNNNRWGSSYVEARILCEKYKVKLHVIERHIIEGNVMYIHDFTDFSGKVPLSNPDYNDQSTIHIINQGYAHFEPLLDRNKSLAKQIQEQKLVQEQEDLLYAQQLQKQEEKDFSLARQLQEQEDFLLAKKLQTDEILEYCNISKDIYERAEVEKRFDELLKDNADGKIHDVVGQCISDIKQHIERSKGKNPLPSCGMEETRVASHQQQQILVK